MHHEHHPGCEHDPAQLLHVRENLGSLCCTGQCNHPEHQAFHAALEQQYRELFWDQPESFVEPAEKKEKEKTKKKKSLRLYGQLAAETA